MRSAAQIVAARDADARQAGDARVARDAHCPFCSFGELLFVLLELGLGQQLLQVGHFGWKF